MKRFVISEDERARILSMHESATKRQYLSEQNDDTRDCKSVNVPNKLCGIYNDAYDRLDGGAKKGFYYDWNKYPGMFVKGNPYGGSFIMEFYAVYPGVFYGDLLLAWLAEVILEVYKAEFPVSFPGCFDYCCSNTDFGRW